ncbi:hypothetical protein BV22DRAFT_1078943 [Leucogyrophana mollusca]|uniref:Uncharacterized protein n=1 Tax=Leucogyrophana mollusca TaxID=85980 RepID=A0ACB8BWQ4_9AGAM|nr:hypothetical protein BV22DRAFT_1078943 [Leucogyrophana mollusca]
MADSDSAPSTSTNPPTRSSHAAHGVNRNPRIHFPDQNGSPGALPESSKSSSLSPGSSVLPMTSSRPDPKSSPEAEVDGRRRVRSPDSAQLPSDKSPSKKVPARNTSSRRKSKRMSRDKTSSPLKLDPFVADFDSGGFSDEYDLSHEDPRILQDVQRALHYQTRRRDRRSLIPTQPSIDEVPTSSEIASGSSIPFASPLTAITTLPSSPKFHSTDRMSSEIDFSPSTRTVPLHPVPLSSNGGATLDWTAALSEEERGERRWLTISKRKGKDKLLTSSKTVVEKQEALFSDKISRIKAEAKPHTLRKAAIISEQLERRYKALYGSGSEPINLAKVARWYASSDPILQTSLDDAEPLTWLKHLLDKKGKRRSPRHLSALIVEEYTKSKKSHTITEVILDNTSLATSEQSPSALSPSQLNRDHGQQLIHSAPSSDYSLGTSLQRIRSSDGHISFEPRVESAHNSVDGERPRNGDGPSRTWRHSLPGAMDSPYSSLMSSSSRRPARNYISTAGGLSPASSRLHFPDIVHRIRRRPYESDEGSSSAINSQSEDHSRSDDGVAGRRRKAQRPRPSQAPGSILQSPQESGTEMNQSGNVSDPGHAILPGLPPPSTAVASPQEPVSEAEILASPPVNLKSAIERPITPRAMRRRKLIRRTSLPPSKAPSDNEEKKRRDEAEEEKLEHEYEIKNQMLEDMKAQNHRLRQRLQRTASDVREYESLRITLKKTLGVPHRSLPPELLDAFSHDPSSVTSSTRRQRGWRAVEDIHNRVVRQRETFRIFLEVAKEDGISAHDSVLDEPISTLMDHLQALENERQSIDGKATEVTDMLMKVKATHATVKTQYNETLSHTSAVYPELSQIVALEESYKDQYQQVWEFGMDALTFILDTVTPFWRNYGKTIGEDIQDFLIIPWYRNEFTGEAKRYNIKSLPRRSFFHWFALLLLFCLTILVTLLQARAAISSTSLYRLPWIDNSGLRWIVMPFFWFGIFVQWMAVLVELCIDLMQLGVVAWWMGWSVGVFT